jgi:hypothetical protein
MLLRRLCPLHHLTTNLGAGIQISSGAPFGRKPRSGPCQDCRGTPIGGLPTSRDDLLPRLESVNCRGSMHDHRPRTARVINLHESLRRQFARNESSTWTSAKERDDVECEPSAPHDDCSSVVVRRKCVSLDSGLIEFGDITTVLG